MSEPEKNKWKRSVPARLGYVLVFMAIVGIIFYVILFVVVVPKPLRNYLAPATFALLLATAIGVAGLLGFLFIRWLRNVRNLRRFLFVLACLITLAAALVTEENWRGRRAWENHRHALEARGEKFSLVELAPPPVPDDQNFAMAPLLKTLCDFTLTNGFRPRDSNAYAYVANIHANHSMPGITNEPPVLGNPIKGSFTDLAAWQAFYRGNTNYPQPSVPGNAAADILTALSRFDMDLATLRDAATTRPYSRFPLDYAYEPAAVMVFPHLGYVKGLAYLVNLRAIVELDLGRTEDAWADLKLGLRFSDAVKGEPFVMSYLYRLALLTVDLQTVREGLVRHAWTDAQLAELDQYLSSLNLLADWKHSIRSERAFALSSMEYLRHQGSYNPNDVNGGPWLARQIFRMVGGGFCYQSMLKISEWEEKYLLPGVDENTRRVFPEKNALLQKEIETVRQHPVRHYYSILAAGWMPAVAASTGRAAQGQSRVDEARIAIAIERYRHANGHLPDSLDLLVPAYLKQIPADVMDGQPLRYHKTGIDAFVLYSVGWNLKDDDGTLGRNPKGQGIDTYSGDWVWYSSTNDFRLE